jgi:hypothetical protein
MTMAAINIFDKQAGVRKDISDSEIVKLTPEQQAAYVALVAALMDTEEADAALIASEKATRAAVTALKKKMEEYEALVPKRTFFDEWKRTVAKMPEPEPDPEATKKIKAKLKEVEKANAALEQCRAAEFPVRKLRAEKRQAFADALKHWSAVDGTPKTVGDLVKENAKREGERKLAALRGELDEDTRPASTVGPSHLDRVKAGGGRGHSANYGYNRNSLRSAQLRPPSVR